MADQTRASIDIAASPAEIMKVIADFERYPEWVDSMKSAEVLTTAGAQAETVRMVLDHQGEHGSQYAAIRSIAGKIGCSGETLRNWLRQAERDQGVRGGLTTDERERIKALEREVRELRQANEILRKASAYFAMAELDRRSK